MVKLKGSADFCEDAICVNTSDRAASAMAGFDDAADSRCRVRVWRRALGSNSSVAILEQFQPTITQDIREWRRL